MSITHFAMIPGCLGHVVLFLRRSKKIGVVFDQDFSFFLFFCTHECCIADVFQDEILTQEGSVYIPVSL